MSWIIQLFVIGVSLCDIASAACEDLPASKTFQEFEYFATKKENCSWAFSPPKGRTNFVLVIKLSTRSYDSSDKIYMPDGEMLQKKTLNRGSQDECRKYVFSKDDVYTCDSPLIRQYCPHQMSVVNEPAQMRFEIFREIRVGVSYAFLACPQNKLEEHVDQLKWEKTTMLIVIVILGLIVVPLTIVSIYLFRKYKNQSTEYNKPNVIQSFKEKRDFESELTVIPSRFKNLSVRSDALPHPPAALSPYTMAAENNPYEELKLYARPANTKIPVKTEVKEPEEIIPDETASLETPSSSSSEAE